LHFGNHIFPAVNLFDFQIFNRDTFTAGKTFGGFGGFTTRTKGAIGYIPSDSCKKNLGIVKKTLIPNAVFVVTTPDIKQNEIVIIINKNVVIDSLTKDDIKNIFLGNITRWQDNKKIILASPSKRELQQIFLSKYIGKTPLQYNKYLQKKFLPQKQKMPKFFKSKEKMIDYIAKTEGSIGYITPNFTSNDVKRINVQ
jgi:hypothetical protein